MQRRGVALVSFRLGRGRVHSTPWRQLSGRKERKEQRVRPGTYCLLAARSLVGKVSLAQNDGTYLRNLSQPPNFPFLFSSPIPNFPQSCTGGTLIDRLRVSYPFPSQSHHHAIEGGFPPNPSSRESLFCLHSTKLGRLNRLLLRPPQPPVDGLPHLTSTWSNRRDKPLFRRTLQLYRPGQKVHLFFVLFLQRSSQFWLEF